MKPITIIVALTISLFTAGCEIASENAQTFKRIAVESIQTANAAGIDPVTLSPEKLLRYSALCGIATSITTTISPWVATLNEGDIGFCDLVVLATAPRIE